MEKIDKHCLSMKPVHQGSSWDIKNRTKHNTREERLQVDSHHHATCEQQSSIVWDSIIFITTFATLLLTPINIAIVQVASLDSILTIALLFCDILWALDSWASRRRLNASIQSLTASLAPLVSSVNPFAHTSRIHPDADSTDASKTNEGLTTSSIIRFLLKTISFSSLYTIPTAIALGSSSRSVVWLSAPRMLRIGWINVQYHNIKKQLEDGIKIAPGAWLPIFLSRSRMCSRLPCINVSISVSTVTSHIFITVIFALLGTSFLACIWYAISCPEPMIWETYEGSGTEHGQMWLICPSDASWISNDPILLSNHSYTGIYIRSLYFVVQTMFTIGFGDIHPFNNGELVFTLFLLLISSLFFTSLISSTTSILSNRDVCVKRFREEFHNLKQSLQIRHVDEELFDSIRSYFDFIFSRQLGMLEDRFLSGLPRHLSTTIKLHCGNQLRNVPFFHSILNSSSHYSYNSFFISCCQGLLFRTFVPGAVVINEGDRKRELVLIRGGRVEIKGHKTKNSYLTLVAGDHMGDFQLLFGTASEINARATVFTEAMVLTYPVFKAAVDSMRRKHDSLCTIGNKDITTSIETSEWLYVYDEALEATAHAYKEFLKKFMKAQTTLHTTGRTRKLEDMMHIITLSQKNVMIHPISHYRLYWETLILITIIYYLLAGPLRILTQADCNSSSELPPLDCFNKWDFSYIFDYACDAIWLMDIFLRSRYFAFQKYEGEREVTVVDKDEVWIAYRSSFRFLYTLILVFPFDLLSIHTGHVSCWRLVKAISLIFFPQTVANVVTIIDKLHNISISSDAINVVNVSLGTLVFVVWASTGWCIIHFQGKSIIRSFYWCLVIMTTVGFGDIIPQTINETMYALIIFIIGPCFFATIMANVISYVHSVDMTISNISHRRSTVESFLCYLQNNGNKDYTVAVRRGTSESEGEELSTTRRSLLVSGGDESSSFSKKGGIVSSSLTSNNRRGLEGLKNVIAEYFDYVEQKRAGVDDYLLNRSLPDYLQEMVKHNILQNFVQKLSIFSPFEDSFKRAIVLALEPTVYFKKEIIFDIQPPVSGMLIIKAGVVNIMDRKERGISQKQQGDTLCENALFEVLSANPFQAKACTDCEILFLGYEKFQELLLLHPNTAQHVELVRQTANSCAQMDRKADKVNRMANILKLPSSVSRMQEIRDNHGKLYINPDGLFYTCWLFLLLLCILQIILMTFFNIAFFEGHPSLDLSHSSMPYLFQHFAVDYLCDCIFHADIIIRTFFLSFYEKNEVVKVRSRIINSYIFSYLGPIHILASLPIDVIVIICMSFGRNARKNFVAPGIGPIQFLALLRVNRLLRVIDIPTSTNRIERALMDVKHLFISPSRNGLRLCKLVICVFLCGHVSACFFFMLSNYAHHYGKKFNWGDSQDIFRLCSFGDWLDPPLNSCNEPSSMELIFTQYTCSLYWTMTVLTTVGFGDVVPISDNETIYAIFLLIVGTSVFALVMVYLQNIVAQLDVTSDIFKSRIDRLSSFLLREKMDDAFRTRAVAHYNTLLATTKGASGKEIREFLGSNSRLYGQSVLAALEMNLLKLFFIKSTTHHFRSKLASLFTLEIYMSGDFIFRGGEQATSLYILESGEVILLGEEMHNLKNDSNTFSSERMESNKLPSTSSIYSSIVEGCFGESEFFTRSLYACSAKAHEDCSIFQTDFDEFWDLIISQQLDGEFTEALQNGIEMLEKGSTARVVATVDSNLSNNKMSKMLHMQPLTNKTMNVIMPDSYFSRVWSLLSLAVSLMMSVTIPFYIAFSDSLIAWKIILIDVLAVVFSSIDMYLRSTFLAILYKGKLVTKPEVFSQIYFHQHFYYDLFCALPIPLIIYGISSSNSIYSVSRIIFILHIRKQRLNNSFETVIAALNSLYRVRIPTDVLSLVSFIGMVWYSGHLCACILCYIGLKLSKGSENWIYKNGWQQLGITDIYLRSYYWSAYTLTTTGYGSVDLHSNLERMFAIVVCLVGAVLCESGLAAVLGNIISHRDNLSGNLRRNLQAVSRFCGNNGLKEVVGSLQAYFDYLTKELDGSYEIDDYNLLPKPLQHQFCINLAIPALHEIKFPIHMEESVLVHRASNGEKGTSSEKLHFSSSSGNMNPPFHLSNGAFVSRGFLFSIARHLKPYIATPGELVCSGIVKVSPTGLEWVDCDLFVLRRGNAFTMCKTTSSPSCIHKDMQEFKPSNDQKGSNHPEASSIPIPISQSNPLLRRNTILAGQALLPIHQLQSDLHDEEDESEEKVLCISLSSMTLLEHKVIGNHCGDNPDKVKDPPTEKEEYFYAKVTVDCEGMQKSSSVTQSTCCKRSLAIPTHSVKQEMELSYFWNETLLLTVPSRAKEFQLLVYNWMNETATCEDEERNDENLENNVQVEEHKPLPLGKVVINIQSFLNTQNVSRKSSNSTVETNIDVESSYLPSSRAIHNVNLSEGQRYEKLDSSHQDISECEDTEDEMMTSVTAVTNANEVYHILPIEEMKVREDDTKVESSTVGQIRVGLSVFEKDPKSSMKSENEVSHNSLPKEEEKRNMDSTYVNFEAYAESYCHLLGVTAVDIRHILSAYRQASSPIKGRLRQSAPNNANRIISIAPSRNEVKSDEIEKAPMTEVKAERQRRILFASMEDSHDSQGSLGCDLDIYRALELDTIIKSLRS